MQDPDTYDVHVAESLVNDVQMACSSSALRRVVKLPSTGLSVIVAAALLLYLVRAKRQVRKQ